MSQPANPPTSPAQEPLPSVNEPTLVLWRAAQTAAQTEAETTGIELAATLTVRPSDRSTLREYNPAHLPLYSLRDAPLPPLPDGRAVLMLGTRIGEGGMGLVRLGQQVSLRRDVAVKTLREGVTDVNAAGRLLHEALITGALEHPNIVPVYDLARDEADQPLLVMKRLEGRTWDQAIALRPPDATPEWYHWLEQQLGVLMQVCQAVHYAHSRGVLHRDLKPSNVMIGDFGETYVLDWGVAVALRPDSRDRFPLVAEAVQMAGTPAYMAPEQVEGGGQRLTPRTDVYLLGAILCQILTGHAPHECQPVMAALYSAWKSEMPDFPPHLPGELAAVCKRALARDPALRFATAEDLRLAIAAFLGHRSSVHLEQQASDRLRALRHQLRERAPTPDGGSLVDRQLLSRLFDEARFGFRQALAIWPDNQTATAGLQNCIELVLTYELDRGDVRRASVLLGELPRPVPELAARLEQVKAAAAAKEVEIERLRQLERQYDLGVGFALRRRLALLIGVVWAAAPVGIGLAVDRGHDVGLASLSASAVAFVLFVALTILLGRKKLLATAVNRTVALVLGTVALGLAAGRVMTFLDGASMAQMLARDHLLLFACTSALALAVDLRLFWAAGSFLAGGLAIALLPAHGFYITGIANLVAMVGLAVLWRERPVSAR